MFMCFGLFISILVFIVLGTDVLLQQWIEGQVGALFVFGTACLIAAACTALFAAIAIIGLVISSAFGDGTAVRWSATDQWSTPNQ
jgi:uncharacterized membrane protein YdcZ (DUF606 family)